MPDLLGEANQKADEANSLRSTCAKVTLPAVLQVVIKCKSLWEDLPCHSSHTHQGADVSPGHHACRTPSWPC
jgi:hypothetical protein